MKVYLAGAWTAKPQLREMRDKLHAAGHTVISRWLDWPEDNYGLEWTDALKRGAVEDLVDIDKVDFVIFYTEVPSTQGGYHTELGYALGKDKPAVVIGPRVSNFFHLPNVFQFPDIEGVIRILDTV